MVLAEEQIHRSMEQNQEPRNRNIKKQNKTKQKKNPETSPCIYGQLIYDKGANIIQ